MLGFECDNGSEFLNEPYQHAWLLLRNYFTPVMKLVEKQRDGSKVRKKYDTPAPL